VGTQVASPPCTDTCQGNNRTRTVICGRRPCLIAHQIVLASRAVVLCKQRTTQASDLFLQLRHRLLQFFNFVTHTEKMRMYPSMQVRAACALKMRSEDL
jgi:hypothetical protein